MAFSFKQVVVCRVVAFFPRPAIGGVLPILRSRFIALRWEVVIEHVVAEGPPTIVMVTGDNPVWSTGVINARLHLRGELKLLASLFFRMVRKHPVLDAVTGVCHIRELTLGRIVHGPVHLFPVGLRKTFPAGRIEVRISSTL